MFRFIVASEYLFVHYIHAFISSLKCRLLNHDAQFCLELIVVNEIVEKLTKCSYRLSAMRLVIVRFGTIVMVVGVSP